MPDPDIIEIISPDSITFFANSSEAFFWMMEEHGDHQIYFNLPSRLAEATAFIASAKANNLSVAPLEGG